MRQEYLTVAQNLLDRFGGRPTKVAFINRRNVRGFGSGPVRTDLTSLKIQCLIGRLRPTLTSLEHLNPHAVVLDIGDECYQEDVELASQIRTCMPETALVLMTCDCNTWRLDELRRLGPVLMGLHGLEDAMSDLVVALISAWKRPDIGATTMRGTVSV